MDLKIRMWLSNPNYGEITYIADKCGGQKKCVRCDISYVASRGENIPKGYFIFRRPALGRGNTVLYHVI